MQARNSNGESPLMRAARLGEETIVLALLAHGSSADAVNDDGNNALWFACLHGSPVVIRLLIEVGTPIDHANDDDLTCLMQVAARGRLDLLKILLAHGASAGLCAPDGRNALDMGAGYQGTDLCLQRIA